MLAGNIKMIKAAMIFASTSTDGHPLKNSTYQAEKINPEYVVITMAVATYKPVRYTLRLLILTTKNQVIPFPNPTTALNIRMKTTTAKGRVERSSKNSLSISLSGVTERSCPVKLMKNIPAGPVLFIKGMASADEHVNTATLSPVRTRPPIVVKRKMPI
jgi:hypothetical protein